SASHALAGSVKTNAQPGVIWDIMRGWVKREPVVQKNIAENSPSKKILSVEPTLEVDFTHNKEAEPPSRKIKLVRYQMNPEKNWGPKPRAGQRKRKVKDKDNEQVVKKVALDRNEDDVSVATATASEQQLLPLFTSTYT
ncbi:2324_t:CDS:2, partial [Paraglomus occultum]